MCRGKAVRHDGCTRFRRAVDSAVCFCDFSQSRRFGFEKWYVTCLMQCFTPDCMFEETVSRLIKRVSVFQCVSEFDLIH